MKPERGGKDSGLEGAVDRMVDGLLGVEKKQKDQTVDDLFASEKDAARLKAVFESNKPGGESGNAGWGAAHVLLSAAGEKIQQNGPSEEAWERAKEIYRDEIEKRANQQVTDAPKDKIENSEQGSSAMTDEEIAKAQLRIKADEKNQLPDDQAVERQLVALRSSSHNPDAGQKTEEPIITDAEAWETLPDGTKRRIEVDIVDEDETPARSGNTQTNQRTERGGDMGGGDESANTSEEPITKDVKDFYLNLARDPEYRRNNRDTYENTVKPRLERAGVKFDSNGNPIDGGGGNGGGNNGGENGGRRTESEPDDENDRIAEYLERNKEKLGRYLGFYKGGDPLGWGTGRGVDEIKIEETLKGMVIDTEEIQASELVRIGREVYEAAKNFLIFVGEPTAVLRPEELMVKAQERWVREMGKMRDGKWAGEVVSMRAYLTPDKTQSFERFVAMYLARVDVPKTVKDTLNTELSSLKDGDMAGVKTVGQALDWLRKKAREQFLRGVKVNEAMVFGKQGMRSERAMEVLLRKFPEMEFLVRSEIGLKDSLGMVASEWDKRKDDAHQLLGSFKGDQEKRKSREMPDFDISKLGTLAKLETSFGEKSYGLIVSKALNAILSDIETADRETTAGVARSSLNPYSDQMDSAATDRYFDTLAIKIAGLGPDFGVIDPVTNKEEVDKRKAVTKDAIEVAKSQVLIFGIAGKGNVGVSTYTAGDQLARLFYFRRGVDVDRMGLVEGRVGAPPAILKADKDGQFALKWLTMGLTFPDFVDNTIKSERNVPLENKKFGQIVLTDGTPITMMEAIKQNKFHLIDWKQVKVPFEKYCDFLGLSYDVYSRLIDANPDPKWVSTKGAVGTLKGMVSKLVNEVYPSQSEDKKRVAANNLLYQILRVVISAHNPLDPDVPTTQYWTDKDFVNALENITRANVLPAKEIDELRDIVAKRAEIILKTPSSAKPVVLLDA